MGRPERPLNPQDGPVQSLAWELRRLREQAGRPSYRRLSQQAHFSASTLAEAAKGERLPSLAVTLAYATACGGDRAEWEARWTATACESAASEVLDDPADGEISPYPGLVAFQPEQAELFFGRSRLVGDVLDRAVRRPVVAVFGASGSGKSSLLRAGVVGRITREPRLSARWRVVLMTPTAEPMEALARQVAKLAGADTPTGLGEDPCALDVAVRNALATGPDDIRVLLVVDQFEEVFTLCAREDERARFIEALVDAAHGPERRATLVLGVRADFLPHLTQYPGLVEALAHDGQVLVGPMSEDELREVIVMPAAGAGLSVDADLLATVLVEAAAEPGALPLISHALRETWRHRTGSALTLDAYRGTGGVRGAIAQSAEETYDAFTPSERQTCRAVLLRLCALGEGTEDTRRPIARSELDGVADAPLTTTVLRSLVAARLVVVDGDTVELAHEALIRAWPRLHRWLTDDRADLVVHRRLTEAALVWDSLDRDQGALYRGAQLEAAAAWADRHPREPNLLEQAFLRAGHELRQAEERTTRSRIRLLRRLLLAMAMLLVLALLGGVTAVRRGIEAREQQAITLARHLTGESRLLSSTDPDLAALLAIAAFRLHPDAESRGSLLSAAAVPRRTQLDTGERGTYGLDLSRDGKLLAAAQDGGDVSLWSPQTRTRVGTLAGPGHYAFRVAFSDDARRLAIAALTSGGGLVTVWDVPSRRKLAERAFTVAPLAIDLSHDGTTVAVGTGNGEIALWDWAHDTWAAHPRHGRAEPIRALAYSPDGRLLVSVGLTSGRPVVWDAATVTPQAELDAEEVHELTFAMTGRTLATTSDRKGVLLWDLDEPAKPTMTWRLPGRPTYAWSISAPVRGRIAVADENGAVTVWDIARREPLVSYQDRGLTETAAIALSEDGTTLVSAGFGRYITLRSPVLPPFAGHTSPVNDLAADGRTVASAGDDRSVRLWDPGGRRATVLTGHGDQVLALALSGNGRLLAALTRDHTITLWDAATLRRHGPVIRFAGMGAATDVALDATGDRVAATAVRQFVWDRGAEVPAAEGSLLDTVSAVAFIPGGRLLVFGCPNGRLIVRDLATGRDHQVIETGQGAVQDVAISPDGRLAATAGADRTVKLWSLPEGAPVATLSGHSRPVSAVGFSPDGRRLAAASEDQTVQVWDVASRRRTEILSGHQSAIRSLAFLADDSLIAGADDGRIIRWTFDTDAAVAALCRAVGRDLTEREWRAYDVSMAPDPVC
ncbi:helix-turn-helix domain-containing protein [Nonomuraea sp. NPDC051941]|uniref:nSTAND1 domain-containing NTPase n=1 Tax=Nonomuraea sp. NPDC051941 TaxID=3364373 RepID=UPI0037C5E3F7